MLYDGNIAFKLTWVYGKKGPFTTSCTADGRDINIRRENKVWCRQPDCPCNAVWRRERSTGIEEPPVERLICYDANAFKEETFGGGYHHSGPLKGQPIHIRHAAPNKFAFFTTKKWGTDESERIVIACYQIRSIEFDDEWGTRALAWPRTFAKVRDFSNAPRYWDFHRQSGGPRWGTGLFRYLPDHEALRLRDAVLRSNH